MSKATAPTMFQAKPNDEKVVKDVYTETMDSDINNYVDDSPMMKDVSDYVKNTGIDMDDVTAAIGRGLGANEDGVSFDFGVASKRLSNGMKGGSANAMSSAVKMALSGNMGSSNTVDDILSNSESIGKVIGIDVDKDMLSDIKILKGGVETIVKGDALDVASIFDLAEQITGTKAIFEYLDIGAQIGMIKTVVDFAQKWNIPEIIDSVLDAIEDADLKDAMMEDNALRCSRTGDVSGVKYWVEKLGTSRTRAISDDLIYNLVRSYRIPNGNTKGMQQLGTEMIAVLNLINPIWDKDRYDTNITCLEYYIAASMDCIDIFTYTDRKIYAASSQLLNVLPVDSIVRSTFPDARF